MAERRAGAPDLSGRDAVADAERLLQLEDDVGPEGVAPLVRAFLQEIDSLVRSICADAVEIDLAVLESHAHRLKANAGSIGARGTERVAAELEQAARRADRRAARELAGALATRAGRELLAVERWLAERQEG
jgi:HPt (histidine-containing phosphotransfer) domain-containing protein